MFERGLRNPLQSLPLLPVRMSSKPRTFIFLFPVFATPKYLASLTGCPPRFFLSEAPTAWVGYLPVHPTLNRNAVAALVFVNTLQPRDGVWTVSGASPGIWGRTSSNSSTNANAPINTPLTPLSLNNRLRATCTRPFFCRTSTPRISSALPWRSICSRAQTVVFRAKIFGTRVNKTLGERCHPHVPTAVTLCTTEHMTARVPTAWHAHRLLYHRLPVGFVIKAITSAVD